MEAKTKEKFEAIPNFLRDEDAMIKFEQALKKGTEMNGVRSGDFISYEAPWIGGHVRTYYRIVLWKKHEEGFVTLIPDATVHHHPMASLDMFSFWYMPPKNIKVIAHFDEWSEKFGARTEDALAYYGYGENTFKELIEGIVRRNRLRGQSHAQTGHRKD